MCKTYNKERFNEYKQKGIQKREISIENKIVKYNAKVFKYYEYYVKHDLLSHFIIVNLHPTICLHY